MTWSEIVHAVAGGNLCTLRLVVERPGSVREYLSCCLRKFDELRASGLPHRDPIAYLCEQGWGAVLPVDRVELPTHLDLSGGIRLDELVILATATRVLRPRKIFEIGTYTGTATSVLILNAPADAAVVTLDLPSGSQPPDEAIDRHVYIDSDVDLVRRRRLGACLRELHLEGRYQQVLCDSLQFDPSPHRGSVELGFIDGAHALPYVRNDTVKMASMLADRGLVFWHDYGGKGRFRPLARYLETLAETIGIYRVSGTTLAWSPAPELRRLVSTDGAGRRPS
ncbi:MAG: class I SAM-dependent methyltransferase [Candidatus Rokubacteria bacterium]|nr:class I SAM-dependent methyltransferase [Candidatus Rokubacteria bacterium]